MYLCLCKAVNDSCVRELGQAGVCTPQGLIEALGLDEPECCGRCARNIHRFVALALVDEESEVTTLSN